MIKVIVPNNRFYFQRMNERNPHLIAVVSAFYITFRSFKIQISYAILLYVICTFKKLMKMNFNNLTKQCSKSEKCAVCICLKGWNEEIYLTFYLQSTGLFQSSELLNHKNPKNIDFNTWHCQETTWIQQYYCCVFSFFRILWAAETRPALSV